MVVYLQPLPRIRHTGNDNQSEQYILHLIPQFKLLQKYQRTQANAECKIHILPLGINHFAKDCHIKWKFGDYGKQKTVSKILCHIPCVEKPLDQQKTINWKGKSAYFSQHEINIVIIVRKPSVNRQCKMICHHRNYRKPFEGSRRDAKPLLCRHIHIFPPLSAVLKPKRPQHRSCSPKY